MPVKCFKGKSQIELYFKRGLEIGCLGIKVDDFQKAPIKIWTKLAWKKNDEDQQFKFLTVVQHIPVDSFKDLQNENVYLNWSFSKRYCKA